MSGQTKKTVIDVESHGELFHLEGRPCSLSAFSHVPTGRNLPKERTYFNSPKKPDKPSCIYDAVFSGHEELNQKLHRCDRRHAKLIGLHTYQEEATKAVPSLSSSEYGHRLDNQVDPRNRSHARIMLVESEFFRRNGVDIGNTKD
ncbi:hypothetical protein CRM22_005253 [Opisthorchis felineus]|uniref:Uncharacterized protein n=1 Tax=Opisthorchis felineus TaxID=147828 RepID=A0A4S2LS21_OPIFE|nr:hypothetical protein CRM22_005253 [Opisthorchis felineus]